MSKPDLKKEQPVLTSRDQFRRNLGLFLCANCAGLYVDSTEIEAITEDVKEVMKLSHGFAWRWDVARGIQPVGNAKSERILNPDELTKISELQKRSFEPVGALAIAAELQDVYTSIYQAYRKDKYGKRALELEPDRKAPLTIILENYDLFYQNPAVLQYLLNGISDGRQNDRTFLLVGAAFDKIPPALERVLRKLERPLPDASVIHEIALNAARSYATDTSLSDDECLTAVFPAELQTETLHAVSGLSETDIEDAYTITLAEYGKVFPKPVFKIKSAMVHKASSLTICEPRSGFEMLGGLDALKEFTLASLRSRADKSLFPKGVLLTGVPGTGKTAIAKCLGREVDLPVVEFRLGKLLGKYIGDSEHAISHTLKVIERMAPVILVIDEIEKAISGGSNSGSASDGGVMRRILGTILTWLQDKTSEVYVIGTCNDIASLPPELSRAGRFDAVFFLDFPGSQQRRKIWNIYRKQHSIPETDKIPNDNGWTGTEIEQCCYMARMLGRSLTESASFIVPIGRSSRDKLEKLREYAEGRFLDATRGGLYDPKNTDILLSDPTPAGTGRRRVRTDLLETPTNNNNNSN